MATKKLPAMARVLCNTVPTTPVTTRRPKSPGPTAVNVDWARPPHIKGETRIELPAVEVWANLAPGKDRNQDRYRCTRCQSVLHDRV